MKYYIVRNQGDYLLCDKQPKKEITGYIKSIKGKSFILSFANKQLYGKRVKQLRKKYARKRKVIQTFSIRII